MSTSTAKILPFSKAAEPLYNALGIERISEATHFENALQSEDPHKYIAVRAGRMDFEGKDGLGFINAVTLHKKIIEHQGYDESLKERSYISLRRALIDLKKTPDPSLQR